MSERDRVTIKIPRPLYNKIQVLIEESSFSSATDFIVYVLRDLVADRGIAAPKPAADAASAHSVVADKAAAAASNDADSLTVDEVHAIKARLRNLGYLD